MWPKSFWMKLRALHPQGVRPRHRAHRARSRPLRQDERPLRRAGRGRRARRDSPRRWAAGRAGARVILADEQSEFGGSLLSHRDVAAVAADPAADGSIDGAQRRWRGWRGPSRSSQTMPDVRAAAAQHRVRLSRPQLPDDRRAPHRSSAAGASARGRASASGACARSRWCWRPAPSSGRWSSRNNDRPGVMLASRGVRVRQPLRRAARHARRRVHQQRQRVSDRAAPRRRGHRGGGGRRRAPRAARRAARARAQGRHRGDRQRGRRRRARHVARRAPST